MIPETQDKFELFVNFQEALNNIKNKSKEKSYNILNENHKTKIFAPHFVVGKERERYIHDESKRKKKEIIELNLKNNPSLSLVCSLKITKVNIICLKQNTFKIISYLHSFTYY